MMPRARHQGAASTEPGADALSCSMMVRSVQIISVGEIPLCRLKLRTSSVRSRRDLEQVPVLRSRRFCVARLLGGSGCACHRSEAVRFRRLNGLELLLRLGGEVHLQKHLTQKLACRRKGAGCDRVL